MSVDRSPLRSRRAVLVGAFGGVAALISESVGRPWRTNAANGDAVRVGQTVQGTLPTKIINNDQVATFWAVQNGSGSAIVAAADSFFAVNALSQSSTAVNGRSGSGTGVVGESIGSGAGVFAKSHASGPGLMGISGSSNTAVSNKPKTGVYGHAVQDGGSRGVWGHSVQGTGVHGDSSSNYGVRGVSSSGVGVSGLSGSGVGVRAESSGGLALLVNGRVAFGSASGRSVIAAGTNKVKVSPGFSVSRSSILATLMGDAGGSKTVKRVAIGSPATSFTIFLTGNAAADVTVAWLVISPSP